MRQPLVEPRVLRLHDGAYGREIAPGIAFMKHAFGNGMSVALFTVKKGAGSSFPAMPHRHAEEVAIQLKGSSRVFVAGKEYTVREGEIIIIPADLEHAGIFTDDEESWLLAIATPPREDYGAATWVPK